jgi:hypothetical protein
MLALVGLTVAAFWLVGDLASRHEGFDWELASIFGTAVGTTLLALSTGWLAYSTRSEVRATQQLAELTREGLAASERPLVLLVGTSFTAPQQYEGVLEIVLRNTGLGPALRVRVKATYTGHSDWRPDIAGQVVPVIEPGEQLRPQLFVSGPQPGPTGGIRGDGSTCPAPIGTGRSAMRSRFSLTG